MSQCERCGHRVGTKPSGPRLGRSLQEDLAFATLELGRRHTAEGGKRAELVARTLHMVYAATIASIETGDDAQLERLAKMASAYLRRHPKVARAIGPHALDNATKIRTLVQRLEASDDPHHEAPRAVRELFPHLPRVAERLRTEYDAISSELAAEGARSPEHLAERALVAAGMPAAEAHQRFAFLRLARSREARRQRDVRRARAAQRKA